MSGSPADKDFNIMVVGGLALAAIVIGTLVWVIAGVLRGLKRTPDLPAPAAAYPLVPFERYSFETTMAPGDVTRTLFLVDDLDRPTYPSRAIAGHGPNAFQARLTENCFTARRSSPRDAWNHWDSALNNPYLPIAQAVVRPGASGTVVDVTLRPLWFYAVPAIALVVLGLADFVENPRTWPMLVVLAIANALLYLMGWRPERAKLLTFLRDALVAPASETADRRPA